MGPKKQQSDGKQVAEGAPKGEQCLSPQERLLKGMGHPLRLKILTHMNDREWSPNELADLLAEGLSQVSYHVKVLKDLKLAELTRTEPRRGAVEHFYRATVRTIITLDMAKEIPKSGRQLLVDVALGEINEDVNESIETGLYESRDDYQATRIPMILDEQGCEKAHELGDKYIEDMLGVAGDAALRLVKSDDPQPMGVSAVLLTFRSARAEREKGLAGEKSPKKKPRKRKRS